MFGSGVIFCHEVLVLESLAFLMGAVRRVCVRPPSKTRYIFLRCTVVKRKIILSRASPPPPQNTDLNPTYFLLRFHLPLFASNPRKYFCFENLVCSATEIENVFNCNLAAQAGRPKIC